MGSVDHFSGDKILSELTWKTACVMHEAFAFGSEALSPAYFKIKVWHSRICPPLPPLHFLSSKWQNLANERTVETT